MSILPINLLGFLALCCYFFTLLPSLVKIISPRLQKAEVILMLLKKRRQIGLLVFALSIAHGMSWVILTQKDISDPRFVWNCWHGLLLLTIFALLAVTSNNWSMKVMKKNWKRLHKLTYAAMFIMGLHVWDKMSVQWTILTPFSLCFLLISTCLYGIRVWKQRKTKNPSLQEGT